MLPWVCSVIDHRRRQNVVRTSVTHSAIASCATFLFLPHFDVICDLLLNRRTATWNLFVKQTTLNHFRFVFYHNIRRQRKWLFQSVTKSWHKERASVVYNFLAIWLVYFPKWAFLIGYYTAWQIDASMTRAALSSLLPSDNGKLAN